jgi:diamine N-acetyltransferase
MISIRQAFTYDIGLIHDLAGRTWFKTYGQLLTMEQMNYMFDLMYSEKALFTQMTEKGHDFFLALEDTIPLGYVSIGKQNESLFHLHKLYVVPEGQQKGIGKILINRAFDYAREHTEGNSCAVELNVNRGNKALDFYQKMGMHIHDQGDFDIGNGYFMNDYILRIDLVKSNS